MERRILGLPIYCPKCPSKSYFGVLKGSQLPADKVRLGKNDRCPNCATPLVSRLLRGRESS